MAQNIALYAVPAVSRGYDPLGSAASTWKCKIHVSIILLCIHLDPVVAVYIVGIIALLPFPRTDPRSLKRLMQMRSSGTLEANQLNHAHYYNFS